MVHPNLMKSLGALLVGSGYTALPIIIAVGGALGLTWAEQSGRGQLKITQAQSS